jgi:hypothetical protein
MIDVNELRVGNRVVLAGKTAPRLILERWKEGNEVMLMLKGTGGIVYETVSSKQVNRVITQTAE